MESREIVRRAIEFEGPPRLPFWQHSSHKMPGFPDDVCNIWEMDRAEAGWFFDNPAPDDWGCQWETKDSRNMGQVVVCPLASWSELGVDVLNMQQPRSYGLVEFGEQFRERVCFLVTVDIQSTMPRGVEEEIREEARLLVRHWSTPRGGLIVFDYGAWEAVGVRPEMPRIMFDEFARQTSLPAAGQRA